MNNFKITALFSLIVLLFSCTPIDKDDYLIQVEAPMVSRAVLIEDFTGQRCIHCPEGTEVIEELIKEYGEDKIIPVAIHSGALGFAGNAKNLGLMNDEGKAYGEYWKIDFQPIGLINRTGGLKDFNDWKTYVYNLIQTMSPVEMDLQAQYQENIRKADFTVDVTTVQDIDAKLQLWILEDGIIAMQSMPDGTTNREYVHNHVFRASVNGMWGDDIKLLNGSSATKAFSFQIPDDWKPENCSIVAFVYNDAQGVMQVTNRPLMSKE